MVAWGYKFYFPALKASLTSERYLQHSKIKCNILYMRMDAVTYRHQRLCPSCGQTSTLLLKST